MLFSGFLYCRRMRTSVTPLPKYLQLVEDITPAILYTMMGFTVIQLLPMFSLKLYFIYFICQWSWTYSSSNHLLSFFFLLSCLLLFTFFYFIACQFFIIKFLTIIYLNKPPQLKNSQENGSQLSKKYTTPNFIKICNFKK